MPVTAIGKMGWRYEAASKQRVVRYRANIGDPGPGLIRKLRRTYRGLQSVIYNREGFITLHILNGGAALNIINQNVNVLLAQSSGNR